MGKSNLYTLYIFDRDCNLVFYHEWYREKVLSISKSEVNFILYKESKLVYGMIFSLNKVIDKLSYSQKYYSYHQNRENVLLYDVKIQISLQGLPHGSENRDHVRYWPY